MSKPFFTVWTSVSEGKPLTRGRRIEEGVTREHNDFLYYILRQNEKGRVSQNEIILNSALFM